MGWLLFLIVMVGVYFYLKGQLSGALDDSKISELDQSGQFDMDVVGESSYQDNIFMSVGERKESGVRVKTQAIVWFEDDNDYDKKAVCVDIAGRTVGYLSRDDARSFRKYIKAESIKGDEWKVPALIIGGKKRGDEWLSYGVKLDLPIDDD